MFDYKDNAISLNNLKFGNYAVGKLVCIERVGSSCSIWGICRVPVVTSPMISHE